MILCESIDTLSMAYHDDELASEERRELELHLTECASCRAHVDAERVQHDLIARSLAAPPAPDVFRVKLSRALDAEDKAEARAARRRFSQWLLPGASIMAAAAAIAVFVAVKPQADRDLGSVAIEASRQVRRPLPLEVEGPGTVPWLKQNFASMEMPQIDEPSSRLVGARLLPRGINGHDGALLSYRIDLTGNPFIVSVLVVRDLRDGEMTDGDEVEVNGRMLHVLESDGHVAVTTVGTNHMGYMFMSPELSTNELVWLVGRTSLVAQP
jgi:anti-sigma factor RsiW